MNLEAPFQTECAPFPSLSSGVCVMDFKKSSRSVCLCGQGRGCATHTRMQGRVASVDRMKRAFMLHSYKIRWCLTFLQGCSKACGWVVFFLFFRFVRVLWDNNKIIFYNLIGCFFLADVADLLSSALIDLWFYSFWLLDPGCRRQVGLYYLFKGYPAAHLLVLVYSVLQSCCFFIDISPAFLIAIAFHYFSY